MPDLTVRAIRATPVEVPLNFVLGTSQGAFRQAPLLLIDLETEEGITGRAYLFCYLRAAAPAIVEPARRSRARGQGRADRAGRALGKARAAFRADRRAGHRAHGDGRLRRRLLGRRSRLPPACRSRAARRRAEAGPGLQQLRPRPDGRSRRARRRGREAAGGRRLSRAQAAPRLSDACTTISPPCMRCASGSATMCMLMVDYNQALDVDEALARGRALDAEDIYWLEEPIRHDDYAGAARLARELKVADPDRREFFAARRDGDGDRARRSRLRDARSRTHRRRHRLAAGRAIGRR